MDIDNDFDLNNVSAEESFYAVILYAIVLYFVCFLKYFIEN